MPETTQFIAFSNEIYCDGQSSTEFIRVAPIVADTPDQTDCVEVARPLIEKLLFDGSNSQGKGLNLKATLARSRLGGQAVQEISQIRLEGIGQVALQIGKSAEWYLDLKGLGDEYFYKQLKDLLRIGFEIRYMAQSLAELRDMELKSQQSK